jgi:carbonic anhydrase
MKTFRNLLVGMAVLVAGNLGEAWAKPDADNALQLMKDGNARFVAGKSENPHTAPERMALAGREDQKDHAYATVLSCSDSRVPVERVFDAGVMDLFVIRVAGNVCAADEIGTIEYGVAHVNTPLLVVMGHSQCGAVRAVVHALHGKGHALERNIPALVAPIFPAARHVESSHPGEKEETILSLAIEENVWQGIQTLFLESPVTRRLVKEGKLKVVGAIYDVGSGKVNWLPESKVISLLKAAETDPRRATQEMAEPDAPLPAK